MDFITLVFTLAPTFASKVDGDAIQAAPFILLLSGFIFYGVMYTRYRNADKRHSHEKETTASIANLAATDAYIKSSKGLSNAKMKGSNQTRVEGALNQSSVPAKLLKEIMPKS